MIKKTISYVDFNDVRQSEDFYFNLNKAELLEMDLTETGGFEALLQKIVDEQDPKRIIEIFKDIIRRSYGIKSADGKRFIKSEEISNDFINSEAYSELFIEMLQSPTAASDFINGVVPADLRDAVKVRQNQAPVGASAGAPAPNREERRAQARQPQDHQKPRVRHEWENSSVEQVPSLPTEAPGLDVASSTLVPIDQSSEQSTQLTNDQLLAMMRERGLNTQG